MNMNSWVSGQSVTEYMLLDSVWSPLRLQLAVSVRLHYVQCRPIVLFRHDTTGCEKFMQTIIRNDILNHKHHRLQIQNFIGGPNKAEEWGQYGGWCLRFERPRVSGKWVLDEGQQIPSPVSSVNEVQRFLAFSLRQTDDLSCKKTSRR